MAVLQNNDEEKMIRKIVERKRIILVLIGVFLFIIGIISYLYFCADRIQHRMKERLCNKILMNEDVLSEIVKEDFSKETLFYAETDMDINSSINYVIIKIWKTKELIKCLKNFSFCG